MPNILLKNHHKNCAEKLILRKKPLLTGRSVAYAQQSTLGSWTSQAQDITAFYVALLALLAPEHGGKASFDNSFLCCTTCTACTGAAS